MLRRADENDIARITFKPYKGRSIPGGSWQEGYRILDLRISDKTRQEVVKIAREVESVEIISRSQYEQMLRERRRQGRPEEKPAVVERTMFQRGFDALKSAWGKRPRL